MARAFVFVPPHVKASSTSPRRRVAAGEKRRWKAVAGLPIGDAVPVFSISDTATRRVDMGGVVVTPWGEELTWRVPSPSFRL